MFGHATGSFVTFFLPRYNIHAFLGSDAPDVVESGRWRDNLFQENNIVGGLENVKLMNADGTQFIANAFEDAKTIRFNDARKTVMSGIVGLDNSKLKVANGAYFDPHSDYGL